MSKPRTANPALAISEADLASALAQIGTEVDDQPLRSSALARIMRETFHGSDAGGAWDWRMAYDMMQAAAIQVLLRGAGATADIANAKLLASRLLTETRRSEQQIRLQQFSTPLAFATTAVRAAAIRKGETVLEPSAGTGALAAFAARAGATLLLNEIDPFRQRLLRAVFGGEVTGHDGEHIDDLLQTPVLPDVVVMNPPFASSVDRSRDKHIAAKHLIASAKRLAPGGRLVAIMPPGFTPERDAAHWSRACGLLTPRLALTMPGQVYRKLGTSVETQLMVFDKVQDDGELIRAAVQDLEEALAYVDAVAATRIEMRPAQRAEAIPQARPTVRSSAPRKTAASPVAASKPRPNTVRPLSFTSLQTPRDNTPISDIYARYRPQRIEIAGAQEHPTPLVESIAMASVAPPVPSGAASAELRLPAKLIEEGHVSEAQLETIIMAHDAHGRDLPGRFMIDDDQTKLTRADDDPDAWAYRLGYFLGDGDGTGCGKGRECAGLILLNWLSGRRKAIWVSKSATLIEDAIRDWTDLGGSPADIQPLSKWKPDQPITVTCGILFVTYATLRSAGKCGTTRLSQILDWMGADFDGVLAFDEAHAMQNAAGSEQGRGVKPSQQGLAGLRLQLAAPRARVFYISATGATSVHNLAYAARLGLWGQGPEYPFPSRESFVSAMEAGGVAAMEVVARDLKTLGLYTARALSFDGVEYDVLEHALTSAQIEIYDAYAASFRTIHHNLEAALTATGVNGASGETNASAARASAKSRFESTKQRFFNHLLMGMKAPTIIHAIADDLAAGKACVIQVVSTGESLLKRRLETMDPEDELVEGALTPRDYVLAYLEQTFPIHAQKLVEIDGNMVAEPLRDETGALVVSREALALRDAAMMELMTLAPIPSALDQILWAFGDEAVAEVTGRSIRPLKAEDGHLFIEKRAASSNSSETQAFMDGDKDILIFSDAGGTGRSYHAAQTAKNQKRRRHYLLEPGWRADAAIQGLGRTHRSAQVSAPFFRVCTSDVHGEKRFTSTIAKRLDQLGALTKGQRETGSQGMFREEDNLESPIARAALRGYFADLAAGRAEAMSYESFTDWTALRLIDKDGVLLEELPPIQRFLNRVLALPIHMQNALFAEFMRRIADQTERARAAGTLDLGVETLRGDKIEQVSTEDLWTCPKSGAVTRIIGLEVTDPVYVLDAEEAMSRNPDKLPMVNRASGRAALISARPMQMYDEDIVTLMRKAVRPNGSSYLEETRFESSAWEEIDRPEFARLWDAEAASLPKTTTTKLYLLTGLLLPIWKDIPTTNERIYRVTPDGATAMIGRTLSEEGAAALRASFLVSNPQTPQEMLTAALGTTAPVDLGRGLTLTRRRVAGEMRLELGGADKGMIEGLKALGCFTEIIAFQLRVFLPHGDGIDTGRILTRILGHAPDAASVAAE
ncbi:strawberry notch family protein [Phaeobacter sp. JH20_36]|jgi:predicted RNA methylase|uniref:Dimethyladenosine transferase (rRNA methylation) n=6 Tax=Rhodobacterales TaxID=204455 RepID=A0AAN1GV45_9RHOB|nr:MULTISPECIES: strawberry notch family protein [Roseobacteraceae]ATG45702.1 Dimethyladenosine transferase (rRNA methylation) [Phaeobacter piscinae]AUQ52171.1 Dimethyladenosine transferase (rRNA methylation) [Phaeobacter inhibens]AUQ96775.1 Dimethyladenosine transferase (rRNA methylation) [Phaeobacter inhibens]AUR21976.1 Dimethyladenosine transferase (rRNA methylation) [Phaeobacter inhibens]MCF6430270.1 strawberry notch family protein [Leisingera sp. MMG026]